MRLRRPCEHDRYESHGGYDDDGGVWAPCPGGEFLPEDALVIWWCEEHGASFQQEADPNPPTWPCWANEDGSIVECRKVEMTFVPVIEKGDDDTDERQIYCLECGNLGPE